MHALMNQTPRRLPESSGITRILTPQKLDSPQRQYSDTPANQRNAHMLWKKGRRSDNVVDARGDGGGGGGMRFGGGKGLSLTAVLLIVGIGWITGQDPMQILGQLAGQMDQSAPCLLYTSPSPRD